MKGARLTRRLALASLLTLVVLLALTPLGPWALLRLLDALAGDWQMRAGEHSGSLLSGFALRELSVSNPEAGVDIAAAHLEVSLLEYALVLRHPRVRLAPVPARSAREEPQETPADARGLRLPMDYFPALDVEQGLLDLRLESGVHLRLERVDIRYRDAGDGSGLLALSPAHLHLSGLDSSAVTGVLQAHLRLRAGQVEVDSLALHAERRELRLALAGHARLDLEPDWPLSARLDLDLEQPPDSLAVHLEAAVDGALAPLVLQVELGGHGRQPIVADMALSSRWDLRGEEVLLEYLRLDLMGGYLEGRARYRGDADSLEAELRLEDLDLARLPGEVARGTAGASLSAALDLAQKSATADLHIEVQRLDALPGEPFDLTLSAAHRPDRSTRLELRSPVLDLTASGWTQPEGEYDLALEGVFRPQTLIAFSAAPISLSGRARPDSLQVRLETPRLPGEFGAEFGRTVLDVGLVQNRFLEASLALEENLVELHMGLDVARGEVDSLVSFLSPLTLDRLVPGLQGQVRGQVRAEGALATGDIHLASRFEAPELAYGGWRTGPLSLGLVYEKRRATCLLEGSGLSARIVLDTAGRLQGHIDFRGALLYPEEGAAPDSGNTLSLTGKLDWQGRLDRPRQTRASLDLEDFSLRQGRWEFRSLQPLRARYAEGNAELSETALRTPVGPLRLSGHSRADSLHVDLALDSLDLQRLLPQLGQEGSGWLRLRGTLSEPLVQGRLDLRAMRLDTLDLGALRLDLSMADSLSVRAGLWRGGEQPEVEVDLTAPAAPLVQGLTAQSPGAARLSLAARQADLAALLTYALGQPVRGRLDLEGAITVPLARLDSTLSWRDFDGRVLFQGLAIEAEVEGDSLHLDMVPGGEIVFAEDRLELSWLQVQMQRFDREERAFMPAGGLLLAGSLRGDATARMALNLADVDLAVFDGPEGKADLQAQISGTPQEPALEATLQVETEDLGALGGKILGDGRGLDWRLAWTTLLEDSLVVTGQVPWDLEAGVLHLDQGRLQVRSEGMGLLIFVDQFPYLDHLDGRLDADLRIEGFDRSALVEGHLGLEGFEFALLDIKPIYQIPPGRLEFSGQRADFTGFSGEGARGRYRAMSLSGFLDMSNWDAPYFSAQLAAEDLHCRYEDIFNAADIDLRLAWEGTLQATRLSGDVRLTAPRSEPVLVAFNAPPVPPPPPALRDEFLENMALDVFVDIRDLEVDSELAEAKATGAIDIGGTFYKPTFQGDVVVTEGAVFVLNRQFDFEKGRIILNSLVPTQSILDVAYDPLVINPELDILATSKVVDVSDNDAEYTVSMTIQGPAKTAAPEFASTPALDFNGIFRLLAFGSPSSQIEYGAALGAAAGQLLSKRVEKVGLDEFTVLPSGTVLGTVGQPSLRLGKYFDAFRFPPFPLWVRYEAAIEDMSLGELRVEHKITSYLTISGASQSAYDRYGLGIGLKKDF